MYIYVLYIYILYMVITINDASKTASNKMQKQHVYTLIAKELYQLKITELIYLLIYLPLLLFTYRCAYHCICVFMCVGICVYVN